MAGSVYLHPPSEYSGTRTFQTVSNALLLFTCVHLFVILYLYDEFMHNRLNNALIKSWLIYILAQLLQSIMLISFFESNPDDYQDYTTSQYTLFYVTRILQIVKSCSLVSMCCVFYFVGIKLKYDLYVQYALKWILPCIFGTSIIAIIIIACVATDIFAAFIVTWILYVISDIAQYAGYAMIYKKYNLHSNEDLLGSGQSAGNGAIYTIGLVMGGLSVTVGGIILGITAIAMPDDKAADYAFGIAQVIQACYMVYYTIAIRYVGQLDYFQLNTMLPMVTGDVLTQTEHTGMTVIDMTDPDDDSNALVHNNASAGDQSYNPYQDRYNQYEVEEPLNNPDELVFLSDTSVN